MALTNAAQDARKPYRPPAVTTAEVVAPNLFACSPSKPNCCCRGASCQCVSGACPPLWSPGAGC
jgi:hypothetical protein